MNPDGMQPYRLTLVGDVAKEIKSLAQQAALFGKKRAYLDAWLAIEKRLANTPTDFGEYCFSLLKGDMLCHIGAIQPVAVRFAIHEKSRDVFVLKVFLLGS